MSSLDDPRLKRFLQGYGEPEGFQEPPGPDGDPQLAALHQYLQTKARLGANDAVVDVGSGRGVLACAMVAAWPAANQMPWYYAIDRQPALDELSLPAGVHNRSRKVDFHTFLNNAGQLCQQAVRIVVLRNVLHELDISTTAKVLQATHRLASAGAEVYIQDVVDLPKGERGKAGWQPDLLKRVADGVGFSCQGPTVLSSKSGTRWFSMIAHTNGNLTLPLESFERAIASAREDQRRRTTDRLAQLCSKSDEGTAPEHIILQAEVAALATQLQQHSYAHENQTNVHSHWYCGGAVPITQVPMTELDFVEEASKSRFERSGLVAILSSKNLIDFPSLLASCRQRAWFMGYSQRPLFQSLEVRSALAGALVRGVELRVLLSHPTSDATRARATSLAYSGPHDLSSDIEDTRKAFRDFRAGIQSNSTTRQALDRCSLRLSSALPSSSFFIIDNHCFVSLYSVRLSGEAGPCLVYREDQKELNAYFQVLYQEFILVWDKNAEEDR